MASEGESGVRQRSMIDVVTAWRGESIAVRWRPSESEIGRLTRGDRVGGAPGDPLEVCAPAPRRRRPDHRGRVTAQRRPRTPPSEPAPLDVAIEIPPAPGSPPPIPWFAAASSLVGGAVVAMLFSPVLAVLAGVSAITVLARSFASRRSITRAGRQRAEAIERGIEDVTHAIAAWAVTERNRRLARDRGPDLDAVLEGATPWQCELDPVAPLAIETGTGRVEVAAPVHRIDEPAVAVHVPDSVTLDGAPLEISVGPGEGVGVCGDREDAIATVRWMLVDACRAHGPSSLGLIVVTTPDRLCDWDWCKWLPHLQAAVVGAGEADGVLAALGGFDDARSGSVRSERPVLVLVDGVEASGPGPLARLLAGRISTARLIWTGAVEDVPAACVSTAFASADDRLEVRSVLGEAPMAGRSSSIGLTRAERVARSIGAFDDPLLDESDASLPNELVVGSVFDDVPSRAEAWRRAGRRELRAVVGSDADGPVELDLVADGPHMLVAGTTGAGKSEFLRTLILGAAWAQPPELVSFLLIDFKGGGAFDLVEALPHVAAVVTDLDALSAERALRALRAELRSREERLRALGVSDIADVVLVDTDEPLPRLVIAVDEFASLADELPEFLDELVDVARRGRSLGVHLVLATQRPAGVVTGQIRANTNLRVCLRVQDRSDSIDVIDRPDAASLPACPGRAVIVRGGMAALVQVARVSGEPMVVGAEPFVLHPALFDVEPDRAAASRHAIDRLVGRRDHERPSLLDLDERIEACRRAARSHAGPPWVDPVESVDLAAVAAAIGPSRSSAVVPLGWLDDPDQRRHVPLFWDSSATGLLVVGADRGDVEATVEVALAGLLQSRPDTNIVVFDGGGGLAGLEAIAGVAAVVAPTEGERMIKALRRLERDVAAGVPLCVVVHRWSAVADGLDDEAGLDARVALERVVREGVDRGVVAIATGADERDVPGRVAGRLSARVVHRLATPSAFLAFDIRPAGVGDLGPRRVVEPTTNRIGMIGTVSRSTLEERSRPAVPPSSIAVLGGRVDRASLAPAVDADRVVIGLDDDLDPATIVWEPGRPVVVLGLPGSGRTTAIETLRSGLAAVNGDPPVVIDDAELIRSAEAEALIADATGRRLVVGATPATARGFGSWIAPLLDTATIVLLNPTRGDGEACRVAVPDLRHAPRGRAVLCDRGRTSIVQIAA